MSDSQSNDLLVPIAHKVIASYAFCVQRSLAKSAHISEERVT